MPKGVIASPSEAAAPVQIPADGRRFDRSCRLVTPQQYAAVFDSRKVLRGQNFCVHILARSEGRARIGLVIPKKQAKLATLRNAIKRQGREAFRLHAHRLGHTDLVLRLMRPVRLPQSPSPAEKAQWREEILGLFEQIAARL